MFVRRIPYSSIRRRRIHNWALLCCGWPPSRSSSRRLRVRSFAAHAGRGRRRCARYRHSARSLLQHGSRQPVGARAGARQRCGRAMVDGDRAHAGDVCHRRGDCRAADQRSRAGCSPRSTRRALSASATRYGPALEARRQPAVASNFPRREVVLVSDFQRSGWSPGDGLRLPTGTTLTPCPVQADRHAQRRRDAGQRFSASRCPDRTASRSPLACSIAATRSSPTCPCRWRSTATSPRPRA